MYAEIYTLYTSPSQASPGDEVEIVLIIQNNFSAPISMLGDLTITYGGVTYPVTYDTPESDTVDPGYTLLIMGHFTMPSSAVTVTAHSYWYGSDGAWHFDEQATQVVNLVTLTPQISQFQIADFVKV